METSNTITKKKYTDRINSESLINFYCNTKAGRKWFFKSYSKKNRMHMLTSNFNATNKSRFTQLFGKHNFVFDGEVRYYAWEFNFKGRKFLALTDKDNSFKGTRYEVIIETDSEKSFANTSESEALGKICMEFTDEMSKILTTVS